MKTGRSRRGNASQIGSSSGSSTFRRLPSGLRILRPKLLADLADADGAGLDVGFELLHRLLAPAGTDVAEVDTCQNAKAILVRTRANRLQRPGQAFARQIVGADQHPQVQLVHRRNHVGDGLGRRQRRRVTVHVNGGELCPRDRMRVGDERRPRPVVDDARRRCIGRLARAWARFRAAGRTLFPGLDARSRAAGPLLRGTHCAERDEGQQAEHDCRSGHSVSWGAHGKVSGDVASDRYSSSAAEMPRGGAIIITRTVMNPRIEIAAPLGKECSTMTKQTTRRSPGARRTARALPPSVVAAVDESKILGIRAGSRSDHRFIGVWPVVVEGRVFIRFVDAEAGWMVPRLSR